MKYASAHSRRLTRKAMLFGGLIGTAALAMPWRSASARASLGRATGVFAYPGGRPDTTVLAVIELGTPAAFDLAGFNGPPLGDDVMDVMLTYAAAEQTGVIPVPRPPKK